MTSSPSYATRPTMAWPSTFDSQCRLYWHPVRKLPKANQPQRNSRQSWRLFFLPLLPVDHFKCGDTKEFSQCVQHNLILFEVNCSFSQKNHNHHP